MSPEILLIGAGGGTRELIPMIAECRDADGAAPRIRGILDDDPALHGQRLAAVAVLGALDTVGDHADARVLIGVATARDPGIRARLFERLGRPLADYATLIHPRAYIATGAEIAAGCVIYPQVSVAAGACIDANTVVYFNTVVHHDSVVGPHSCVCGGVCIAGRVRIGASAYIGAGATVRDGVTVGAGATIGLGAAVVGAISAGAVVKGVPAK